MKRLHIIIPLILVAMAAVFALGLSVTITRAQSFGSGWVGSYFNNNNLSGGPVVGRVDDEINFAWGDDAPEGLEGFLDDDNFSVRWTTLEDFAPGVYRFTAGADDGIRVKVDGQTIIDNFGNTGSFIFSSVDYNVQGGTRELTVEYVEREGTSAVQFFWEPFDVADPPTAGPSPTPTATGLPPIPPGALTATVIRASVLNVRDAPSLGGNVVGRVLRGQTYQIVGRDPDARWFLIQLSGFQGWVWGYYIFVNGNEFTAPVRSASTLYSLPAGFTDTGVIAQTRAVMKLRARPDVFAEQTGRITWGAFLPVVQRTPAGDWYLVLWKGTLGWVFTDFTEIVQGDLNNVPVVNP